MKLLQCSLTRGAFWSDSAGNLSPAEASLVFAFGQRVALTYPGVFEALRERFPAARIVLVSTAGSLADTRIEDEAVVCTALRFERTATTFAVGHLNDKVDLAALCRRLVADLAAPDLRHVLIFSDGILVNGTTLSDTFNEALPAGVTLSGGLAADGTDFLQTLVGLDAPPTSGVIVAIGLCASSLHLRFGSSGGWTPFGIQRIVTAAEGNVLQSLDGKPALELYKTYLGPEAENLPASALRFPLSVTPPGQANPVVRTILSIDEAAGSMTFAGDIPVNATVQLMRASYEDLIAGVESAVKQAVPEAVREEIELVLCVSCVGRRIVLGQRTEEELEGVRAAFGPKPVITGFYSYGELAPSGELGKSQLHNQTMTITGISEGET